LGIDEAVVVCHSSRDDDDDEEEAEEETQANAKYIKRPEKLSMMELHT